MPTVKFFYTGSDQTFTIPAGVGNIFIQAWGAAGGSSPGTTSSGGGAGGYSEGRLNVTPNQLLTVIVGEGGKIYTLASTTVPTYGGGGAGGDTILENAYQGSSGGGRSAVRLSDNTEVITAGGGGGSAGFNASGTTYGGTGGGLNGLSASVSLACLNPKLGAGGSQVAGGAGGIGFAAFNNGVAGSQFTGGTGGGGSQILANSGSGGGGGGGYYGGGGGAGQAASGGTNICPPDNRTQDISGGGGSGYIGGVTSGTTLGSIITSTNPPRTTDPNYVAGVGVSSHAAFPTAANGGNGLVVFSYSLPLSLTKSTDQAYATIGSTITYTVTLANTAAVTLNNVVFVDTVPNGTSFISNSISINGTTIAGNPAPPGVNIGDFSPNSINTVTFQVLVNNTIPSPNTLVNNAIANFEGSTIPTISNNITTTILAAVISSSKIAKPYANIGDVLTYTIVLSNTGNTTATDIRFIDTIPNGTTLIAGSIRQGTTVVAGTPDPPGVTLPNPIRNGTISTVTFQVRVITLPSPNPIQNSAMMTFSYTINNTTVPNITGSGSSNTNIANTFINRADLSNITKATDKDFATINDVITYTITIPNTGTTNANDVIFRDTIPTGTTFVTDSFTVNGVVKPGVNPTPPGTNIGTIPAGDIFTVTFKVIVNTIPSPNLITNTATTTFTYQVDPSVVTTTTGNANSNIVSTTITKAATIVPTKLVNTPGAFVGNTLSYTIVFENTGSTTANSIFFTDTTPNGTTFITDSINVNGTTITGGILNPPSGVTIPDLGVGQIATLTFQVTVDTIPVPNPTTNIGTTSYSYIDTDSGATGTKVNNTNIVSTFIYPGFNPFKAVDKEYATIGDTITYTLGWLESLGVEQTNVTFVDTIPSGTTFIPNSVMVAGISIPGATVTAPNGINIGTLPANQIVTVSFMVTVDTLPTTNPIPNETTVIYTSTLVSGAQSEVSNTVTTQINYSSLDGLTKNVDKDFVIIGDTLTYTITLVNSGNTTINNVIFFDTIPDSTTFIDNSLVVNGVTLPSENPEPPTGASIGTIPAGEVTTISFKVIVNTIPSPNSIPNTASVIGDYIVDPIIGTTISVGGSTNTVLSKVNFADLSNPLKVVDKVFSGIPTTLTYSITIVNSGNTTANNVVFIDTIPSGAFFVLNSVFLNGVQQGGTNPMPPSGFTIGTIPAGATFTLTFKVSVDSIPTVNPMPNTGTIGYDFIVDPTLGTTSTGTYNTNTAYTTINHADLSNIVKFTDKSYGKCGEIITYTISIPNDGNTDALNVVLSDTVPNGTTYIPNSLQVDGNPILGTPDSINIGTILVGNISIVTFKVQVNC